MSLKIAVIGGDGRWHYYRLAGKGAPPAVKQTLKWTLKTLENQKALAADARAIGCVRGQDPSDLTACYRAG